MAAANEPRLKGGEYGALKYLQGRLRPGIALFVRSLFDLLRRLTETCCAGGQVLWVGDLFGLGWVGL